MTQEETMSVPFVNGGKEFMIPLIRVSDIRAMQLKRSKITDPDYKELEASVSLVHALLKRIDNTVTEKQIEEWEYAEFVKFVKVLWGKNAENFRGILPNLPTSMLEKK